MEQSSARLEAASRDLYFLSESDFPFETVAFEAGKLKKLTPADLKKALELPEETKVEKQDLPYFFRNQTRDLPGANQEDKATAERFRELQQILSQELENVTVFRVGEVQV